MGRFGGSELRVQPPEHHHRHHHCGRLHQHGAGGRIRLLLPHQEEPVDQGQGGEEMGWGGSILKRWPRKIFVCISFPVCMETLLEP